MRFAHIAAVLVIAAISLPWRLAGAEQKAPSVTTGLLPATIPTPQTFPANGTVAPAIVLIDVPVWAYPIGGLVNARVAKTGIDALPREPHPAEYTPRLVWRDRTPR